MKRLSIRAAVLLVSFFISMHLFGQSAVVMLKFEDAEKAFNQGDYTRTLELLSEVEKAAGVTSQTLYLRIMTENKLFDNGRSLFNNVIEFERLENLRKLSDTYLKELSGQGIDDKYRDVYRISEQLDSFPKTREGWKLARDAYEKKQQQDMEDRKKALAEQAARNRAAELSRLRSGTLTLRQMELHQLASITEKPVDGQSAVLYILRPEEDTRNMTQMLYINDQLVEKKMKPGLYVQYSFTPGVVKIGKVNAKNKRKVSKGAAILMGGVIGLAATSGKTIAQSDQLFFLELEPGKSYYVTAVITKDKKIHFASVGEENARKLMAGLKQMD